MGGAGRPAVVLLAFLTVFAAAASFAEESHPVLTLEVSGTIDPAQARYITRGLELARKVQASALVIQMDTPGGLDGSMRKIIQGILNSPVPVIVYVAPPGARAASAGCFIALSAHVAAMAPGTNIGAAHPVHLGGGGSGERASPMEHKLTNDAAAYIHSIAQIRDRNSKWAEESVRESRSSSAEEAKENDVIDVIAKDLDDLVEQVQGRPVKTVFGVVTLSLKGEPLQVLPMSLIEKILHQLAHPNLAYILLLLGIYGLIYELATPGAVFPGVLGAIFLILSLLALETLEVNWAGLILIVLSLIFFIADIKLPGYGALTAGGIVSFLLGSAILFPGVRIPNLKLPLASIGAASVTTACFFGFIVGAGIRALQRKVTSGIEGLIGAVGVAKTDLKPKGFVHIKGEEWQARSDFPVKKGMRVKVVRLEGLILEVEPAKEDL